MTEYIPKPLAPVVHKPILSVIADMLLDCGVDGLGFNLHHLPDSIERYVKNNITVPSAFFYEREILGTGASIGVFAETVEDDFFIVYNGDIVSDLDVSALVASHAGGGADVTMALIADGPANKIRVLESGEVVDMRSELGVAGDIGSLLTFSGVAVYSAGFARSMPVDRFYSVIDFMIEGLRAGKISVRGFVCDNVYWNDIGDPRAYLKMHHDVMIDKIFKPKGVSAGSNGVFIAENAVVGGNFDPEGFVAVSSGVVIGSDVKLKNSLVLDSAKIADGAEIAGAVVGPGFLMEGF